MRMSPLAMHQRVETRAQCRGRLMWMARRALDRWVYEGRARAVTRSHLQRWESARLRSCYRAGRFGHGTRRGSYPCGVVSRAGSCPGAVLWIAFHATSRTASIVKMEQCSSAVRSGCSAWHTSVEGLRSCARCRCAWRVAVDSCRCGVSCACAGRPLMGAVTRRGDDE
ncbi:hypothetical protein B0H13DRAFT_720941 [Mycena leptocephala]|nr:hypothetical protein B0H13DRAFT_720941 [Mycena leptocephala]